MAMESTGVYGIPTYELLEARGFQVSLVNARSRTHGPGRQRDSLKTTVGKTAHGFNACIAMAC